MVKNRIELRRYSPQSEGINNPKKNKPSNITKADFGTLKNFLICCSVVFRGLRLFVELQVALL
jgi:hypothetical protein